MNINLQNYYNDALQYNVKGDGSNVQNTVNATENMDSTNEINLKDLLIGDVFSGKINNITNYEVDILLDNNQHINATMQQALELNIGDKMLFQVKDKNDSQIYIRPVANNEVSMDLVNKSLMAAGLSVTDKNVAIVKELIGGEQPIDRQSILNMIRLTSRFGSENIDKLIDMTKNGIEVNENNLKMYDVYMQSKHQISSNINDIQNNIIKYLTDIPESSQGNSSASAEVINNKINDNIELLNKLSYIIEEHDNYRQESDVKESVMQESDVKEPAMQEPQVKETVVQESEAKESAIQEANVKQADIQDSVTAKENVYNSTENTVIKSDGKLTNNQGSVHHQEDNVHREIFDNELSGRSDVGKKNSIANENMVKTENAFINKTNPFEKADSFRDIADILKQMSEGGMEKEDIIKLMQSDKLSRKIADIFEKKLYLNPAKLSEDKEKIKEGIDKLYEKLDKLSESIKENIQPAKNGNLTDSASNLRNNMNFMNELNNIESYVQLPIKFSEGRANGDLYVYNKKRGKYSKGDVLTAFLHLDMQYLGATDVNITMEKKNVVTRFTLSDDESMKIVSSHLDELIEKIQKLGYIVKMSTEVVENVGKENTNPLQPITENNEKAVAVKRYTLDIRT